MKHTTFTRFLLLGVALTPAALAQQGPAPSGGFAPVKIETTDSARASTDEKPAAAPIKSGSHEGKGTVTITIEKDGKTETKTVQLDGPDKEALAKKAFDSLHGAVTILEIPKKKVTYLGVMLAEAAGAGAELGGSDLPAGAGLAITGVTDDSPAAKAGLQSGDVLTRLNDQILVNPPQFTTLIRGKKEGETIKLAFLRHGESKDAAITLAAREEEAPSFGGMGFGLPGIGGGAGSGGGFSFPAKIKKIAADPNSPNAPVDVLEARVLRIGEDNKITAEDIKGTLNDPAFFDALAKLRKGPARTGDPEASVPLSDNHQEGSLKQVQEQLAKLRAQWTEAQQQALEDYRKTNEQYRKTMDQMREELARATKDARKAQEDARRAMDEARQKFLEETNRPQETKPAEAPKAE